MNLKVMIADDDQGMRLVLRKLIESTDGFELAAEADCGESCLHLFEIHRPGIVFLDVEMPGLTGIECAKRIMDIDPKTIVVFATAHDEYMSDAFEVYAFDYIVKPFRIERVKQTLQRIKALHYDSESRGLKHKSNSDKSLERLIIKNKDGISFVTMQDIILVQREDRSTVIYTAGERYVTSEGLSDIEEKLDDSMFFRSHKSYIINLSMIQKIYPYGRWTYTVKLKNTAKDALLTYDRYDELENAFKGNGD